MTMLKNGRDLRSFIGMINYYHDMWKNRLELLAPLTLLTSTESKWDWIAKHQKVFNTIKNSSHTKTTVLS